MPLLLSTKEVTARKPHPCHACGRQAITPGDQYIRESYVYDSRVYTLISCRECSAILSDVYSWAGMPAEGVTAEDFYEWASEYRYATGVAGDRARSYLRRLNGIANGGAS